MASTAVLGAVVAASLGGGIPAGANPFGTTTRSSVTSGGSQANAVSLKPTVSADGRYVAFTSEADNLVAGDTNSVSDIFVHDRQTLVTTRVSVASDGSQAIHGAGVRWTQDPAISPDGRYVAFISTSDNLAPGASAALSNLFVHDRTTGETTVASPLDADRTANPAFSADGRYLAFNSDADDLVSSDTNRVDDVFVHDRSTGATTRVSVPSPSPVPLPGTTEANGDSNAPAISGDGRYVAFHSLATNLAGPAGDTNNLLDVFVHDRQSGTTTRASVGSDGAQGAGASSNPSISADGRFVSFTSSAANLVASDTNGFSDILVRDTVNATTSRASVASGGGQSNNYSYFTTISADGRYVAFTSAASNLVGGDTNARDDTFRHDRQTGATIRVNVAGDGSQGNNTSLRTAISADGRHVAFDSQASNLVPDDTNGVQDVFVHDTAGATLPPALSVGDASVEEGDTTPTQMTFTVNLNRPAESPVSVAFATADATAVAPGDYQATSGTLSFPPGTTARSVVVAVNGDTDVEGDETFTLALSAPSGATLARVTAVGTIVDAEAMLTIGDVTVAEGDAGTRGAVFTVSLSRPTVVPVAVAYASANNTALKSSDYTRVSGTLDFAPGTTTAKVKVPVVGDLADEAHETFTVALTNPQGAAIADGTGTGTGTIFDDDPASVGGPRVTVGDVVVHEGNGGTRVASFTVSLSRATASTVTVDFATDNGTAVPPGDYVSKSGVISLAAGTISTNVKIVVNGDTSDESNETFSVRLSNLSGPASITDAIGTGTIVDDD